MYVARLWQLQCYCSVLVWLSLETTLSLKQFASCPRRIKNKKDAIRISSMAASTLSSRQAEASSEFDGRDVTWPRSNRICRVSCWAADTDRYSTPLGWVSTQRARSSLDQALPSRFTLLTCELQMRSTNDISGCSCLRRRGCSSGFRKPDFRDTTKRKWVPTAGDRCQSGVWADCTWYKSCSC